MTYLESSVYKSPIGEIVILHLNSKLCYLDFAENDQRMHQLLRTRFGQYQIDSTVKRPHICKQLDRYFAGKQESFDGVEIDTGGTDFQQKVWKKLMAIPRGKTLDYSALAKKAGRPKAVRAAASSNARNPISIVIPCHRVIGKDGSLRGYAGGKDRKQFLLELEGAM